jgi:hypothetical protein
MFHVKHFGGHRQFCLGDDAANGSRVKFPQGAEQADGFGLFVASDSPVFWRCGLFFLQIDRALLA